MEHDRLDACGGFEKRYLCFVESSFDRSGLVDGKALNNAGCVCSLELGMKQLIKFLVGFLD